MKYENSVTRTCFTYISRGYTKGLQMHTMHAAQTQLIINPEALTCVHSLESTWP